MRSYLLIIYLLLWTISSFGQQNAQFSHFLDNYFAINPAVAGSKSCIDVKLGHRQQWLGFEGAPRTSFATIHSVLKKNKYSIERKHAIGLDIENDAFGPFNRSRLQIAYAYHFPVGRDLLLSTGIYFGIEQFRFKASDLILANYNDNAIQQNQSAFVAPLITPGLFLQSKKWFGGITMQQFFGNPLKDIGTDETKLYNHFSLLAGMYLTKRRSKIAYIPNAILKLTKGGIPALDVSFLVEYDKNFTFGVSYRNTDAIVGLLKFNMLNYLTISYAFDYTTSKIQNYSSNTHELTIGINPCGNRKKSNLACPVFN